MECPTQAYRHLVKTLNSLLNLDQSTPGLVPKLDLESPQTRTRLIRSILTFPEASIEILSDTIINQSYTFIQLLAVDGDPLLVYALLSRGVSVRTLRDFSQLSPNITSIIVKARSYEGERKRFVIPPEIQGQLKEVKRPTKNPSPIKTPQPDKRQITEDEDKEDIKPDHSKRSYNPKKARLALALQKSNIKEEEKEDKKPVIKLENSSSKLQLLNEQPPSLPDHPAPYVMKVTRIPREATELSIQTFFEVGADAFKLANKLNHQLDALGRSVEKYRPGHRSSSSESSTIRSKFPKLNQHNLSIVKEQMDDDHKIYKTARIVYDTAELARAAVLEFHHQRYLPRDLIRKRLRCEFE